MVLRFDGTRSPGLGLGRRGCSEEEVVDVRGNWVAEENEEEDCGGALVVAVERVEEEADMLCAAVVEVEELEAEECGREEVIGGRAAWAMLRDIESN